MTMTTWNKRRMATNATVSSTLPEDMETEVLLRVPAKSIIRFRAVCSRWAALLSSEKFRAAWTKLVESRTTEPASQLLFLPLTPPWTSSRSTEVRCGDGRLLLTLDGMVSRSAGFAPAPCHGLILLQDPVSGCYHVLNAATRAVTTLPPHRQKRFTSSASLGFDAKTKEYKVVRLFSTATWPLEWFTSTMCEVYTVSRGPDRRWRPHTSSADGLVLPATLAGAALFATLYDVAPVFVDGFLHWLVHPTFHRPVDSVKRPVVLSFSVSDETFSSRVGPPPFDWHVHEAHLAVLDGRLCMVRDLRGRSSSTLEIWNYGAAADGGDDGWSLKHNINLAQHAGRYLLAEPRYVRVVGASVGKIKVIFIATSKGNVVAYDPMHGTLGTILPPNLESDSRQSLARFSLFKESLSQVH